MNDNYSDYIVYVDESGDHGLSRIDKDYPVFVLVFCIFKKSDYMQAIHRTLEIKFKYFGHDMVIFHESDIRRRERDFRTLTKAQQNDLNQELAGLVKDNNFTIVSTVIKKQNLKEKCIYTNNPYHLAMGFCLEGLYNFLKEHNNQDKTITVVVENRGKNEDKELELEFKRWCDGDNLFNKKIDFDIKLVSKQSNSTGLQIADLIARPIGISVFRPEQPNQAFDVIKNKFRTHHGHYKRAGLKIFP